VRGQRGEPEPDRVRPLACAALTCPSPSLQEARMDHVAVNCD
jgi:hypothetical protein